MAETASDAQQATPRTTTRQRRAEVVRRGNALAEQIPPPGAEATVMLPCPVSKRMDDIPTKVVVLGRVRCVRIGPRVGSPEPLFVYWVRCRVDGEKEARDIAAERFVLKSRGKSR